MTAPHQLAALRASTQKPDQDTAVLSGYKQRRLCPLLQISLALMHATTSCLHAKCERELQ